jgi:hypothetical protein
MNQEDLHKIKLSKLLTALPDEFPFYHLGRVQKHVDLDQMIETRPDSCYLVFDFVGENRALMILAFDRGLDASIYEEIGNTIASQIADGLAEEEKRLVMPSPPRILEHEQIKKIIQSHQAKDFLRRQYFHLWKSLVINVEMLILPFSLEETAYA